MKVIIIYDCNAEFCCRCLKTGFNLNFIDKNAKIVICFSSQLDSNSFFYKTKIKACTVNELKNFSDLTLEALIATNVQKGIEFYSNIGIGKSFQSIPMFSVADSSWIISPDRPKSSVFKLAPIDCKQLKPEVQQKLEEPLKIETFHNAAMPKVGLVLATYNNEEETMKFFKSFFDHNSGNFNVTIYWIDNGSTQESVNRVNNYLKKKKADNVKIEKIRKPEPLGYAPAVNIGIRRALEDANDWIVLQNNDTEIVEDYWLDELIDPSYDAVVPLSEAEDSVQHRKAVKKKFPEAEKSFGERKKIDVSGREDYIPTTFCAAIHSSVFKKIGLIDENFKPGYAEDTDFFIRMNTAGLKTGLALGVEVKHVHGATFDLVLDKEKKKTKKLNIAQCFIKNSFSNLKKKKGAVYTCITGKFDDFKSSVKYDTENFDYFIFTDDPSSIAPPDSNWKVVDISMFAQKFEGDKDQKRKLARFIKLSPHLFLSNYEISVWIDGNLSLDENAYTLIERFAASKDKLLTTKHPDRDCIYDEAEACKAYGKESAENVEKIIEHYKSLGVPRHLGLVDSKFMLRKHNDKEVIALMEKWLSYIKDYTKRDQLSFNLVCWLEKFEYKAVPLFDLYFGKVIIHHYAHLDYLSKGQNS